MKDTLLFKVSETSRHGYMVERLDLSKKENKDRMFSFSKLLRDRDIDPLVGRNRMLSFLRIYGVLTSQNIPNPNSHWIRYFDSPSTPIKAPIKIFDHYNHKIRISGVGILLLRRVIEMVRERGGSL